MLSGKGDSQMNLFTWVNPNMHLNMEEPYSLWVGLSNQIPFENRSMQFPGALVCISKTSEGK